MTHKETAFLQIHSLITRFEEQQDSYQSGDYNEPSAQFVLKAYISDFILKAPPKTVAIKNRV
jgi:hypothetical protein